MNHSMEKVERKEAATPAVDLRTRVIEVLD
jgi:hypothetical protein